MMITKLILSVFFAFPVNAATPGDIVAMPSATKAHAFRLTPGQDFFLEITDWAKKNKIKAAAIVSAVGSFKKLSFRYANQNKATTVDGFFEIVSVTGTLNEDAAHLHASVSTEDGKTLGGHLVPGNIIYTTAEVVVLELTDIKFSRELDKKTTYKELTIQRRQQN